jgi:hypothetical protein
MTRKQFLHLHRTPWWRVYAVHMPDGTFIGNVYPASVSHRLPDEWPRASYGWVAIDQNHNVLAAGLESRYRAIEFVSER